MGPKNPVWGVGSLMDPSSSIYHVPHGFREPGLFRWHLAVTCGQDMMSNIFAVTVLLT